MVDLNQDLTAARRNDPAEAGPTKTHHNRRTPATKKHAVRVLGRYGNKRGEIPGTGFCQFTKTINDQLLKINRKNEICKGYNVSFRALIQSAPNVAEILITKAIK